MHDDAPRLDGIHHLKLPVTDLERSSSWYRSRLGYEPDMEFHREGRQVGLALKHPNGGPAQALWLDAERAAAAAGFDYFAIGVPTREALGALAERLGALGERHPGVHPAAAGWILPHVADPDGHELRFYLADSRDEGTPEAPNTSGTPAEGAPETTGTSGGPAEDAAEAPNTSGGPAGADRP